MTLTSAAGILALLDEKEPELKAYALRKLNSVVDEFWPEISEDVDKIEMLYEDETFNAREFAALLASKVYYHLGSFEDSLMFALGAGNMFDVNGHSEFVETTIAKCIDHYTQQRVKIYEGMPSNDGKETVIDPKLEAVVNRMFQRCFDDGKFKQAIGISLETRRLDIFEQAILKSDDIVGMLSYSLKVCMSLIQSRQFRNEVLNVLVKLYLNLKTPDYINVCQCCIFLDDAEAVVDILDKLVKDNETDQTIMAYQIAFDLYENATQQFLSSVNEKLRIAIPMITDAGEDQEKNKNGVDKVLEDRIKNLQAILSGETTIGYHLEFLIRNNHADLLILKNTKDASRNSVCHTATVISNALMHCGTTTDTFLRNNLEWLARATNWAKFTATASLGVIHRGHEQDALKLMASYLPKDSNAGSAYQEGGGLYALGLIHANHGENIIDYILQQLKSATSDMVRHGGCLGLGLAAMGTAREDIYNQLKDNLYHDDAVTGEAAGLGMGLVMLGSFSSTAIDDMVAYARETKHEKILRGLSLGISLVMYSRMEEADALIDDLSRDKDPNLRICGMYTIAMAYCGTGNNKAIKQLLHVAVSDVNDDVRRAAVVSLGFLMFRTPEQCPSVVSLLSESYNPHVRYGAAIALGISCAGTGLKEAVSIVEPMTNDPVNYVRQGALIASSLLLIQHNDHTNSKVAKFREIYSKVIADKHEDQMAKFGSIIAQGILDAGGRNVTISLQSRAGHTHMMSVVGLLVFTHFWYWFPLTHFISLAFTPTCLIGLNSDVKMPKMKFISNAKPSLFAYPEALKPPKKEEREKVTKAVLSFSSKAKKTKKDAAEKEEPMDVDKAKSQKEKEKGNEKEKDEDSSEKEKSEKKDSEENKKETEPESEMLDNPSRVMRAQLKLVSLPKDSRYSPLKPVSVGGIVMMRNSRIDEPEELLEPLPAAKSPSMDDEDEEPEPPEPFEYIDEDKE